MTLGRGGHMRAIIEHKNSSGDLQFISTDRDPQSACVAQEILTSYPRIKLEHHVLRFSEVNSLFAHHGQTFDFILIDLGVSTYQIKTKERGFSFADLDEPHRLDMRMNQTEPFSAYELVNSFEQHELASVFMAYSEERLAKKVAREIYEYRKEVGKIETNQQLRNIILNCLNKKYDRKNDVLSRIFQAIRIFVNDELNEICYGIENAYHLLRPQTGTLAIISFHSLEDRIVKYGLDSQNLIEEEKGYIARHLCASTNVGRNLLSTSTGSPNLHNRIKMWSSVEPIQVPSQEEITSNPSSRSAKLRVAVKN